MLQVPQCDGCHSSARFHQWSYIYERCRTPPTCWTLSWCKAQTRSCTAALWTASRRPERGSSPPGIYELSASKRKHFQQRFWNGDGSVKCLEIYPADWHKNTDSAGPQETNPDDDAFCQQCNLTKASFIVNIHKLWGLLTLMCPQIGSVFIAFIPPAVAIFFNTGVSNDTDQSSVSFMSKRVQMLLLCLLPHRDTKCLHTPDKQINNEVLSGHYEGFGSPLPLTE